jgi:hypothetical protein
VSTIKEQSLRKGKSLVMHWIVRSPRKKVLINRNGDKAHMPDEFPLS